MVVELIVQISTIVALVLALWQTWSSTRQARVMRDLIENKYNELHSLYDALHNMLSEDRNLLIETSKQINTQVEQQRCLLEAAQNQTLNIQAQLEYIGEIRDSLSTKFLGRFTDFFPHVISLIEMAKTEIIICSNFPSMGVFSMPDEYMQYRQIIERKIFEKKTVELIFTNKDIRLVVAGEQFREDGVEWDQWKNDNKKLLTRFLERYARHMEFDSVSREVFMDIIEKIDEGLLQREFADAQPMQIADKMFMYFWMVDGRNAIFSISPNTDRRGSYGFSTSDDTLLTALSDMRMRYRRGSLRDSTSS
jgi:hypothetical protein